MRHSKGRLVVVVRNEEPMDPRNELVDVPLRGGNRLED